MNFIPVNQVPFEKLEQYMLQNEHIERKMLGLNGYVIEMGNKIEGSFLLEDLNNDDLWLKKLYITKEKADLLLIVLEMIIQLAKQKQAKHIYVHSHQPVVDILLEALQFSPEMRGIPQIDKQVVKGNWWMYAVS